VHALLGVLLDLGQTIHGFSSASQAST
jgi:hypothetical protein